VLRRCLRGTGTGCWQALRTQQLAVALDDHVAVAHVIGETSSHVEEAVVLVAQVARFAGDGDLLGQAGAQRVGARHDEAVVDAQLQEGVAHGADLGQEVFVRHGDLAVLVAALLLVRHLVFDLDAAGARFDHLLGHQVGRFGIAEAGVDVGDDRHHVGDEIVDLVLDGCLAAPSAASSWRNRPPSSRASAWRRKV
jgi:hypothetical protein